MVADRVVSRLEAILDILNAAHRGGQPVSSASKGQDRELFITNVLRNVISAPFRVGSGDIVDYSNRASGQVDTVIEYANTISFHTVIPDTSRLYLAESVCAVIEVKSDLKRQWDEIVETAEKVCRLERATGAKHFIPPPPPIRIPVFGVGYKGWQNPETAKARLEATNKSGLILSGILQIDPCFYIPAGEFAAHRYDDLRGLFGFFLSLEQLTSSMIGSKPPFKRYID